MISPKVLGQNLEKVISNLKKRRYDNGFIEKVKIANSDGEILRNSQLQLQDLQKKKNLLIKDGISSKLKVIEINKEIQLIEKKIDGLTESLEEILPYIPNFLEESVPEGDSEKNNVELYRYGNCSLTYKNHYDMEIIGAANEMTGSRFVFLEGQIATLERAVGNFLINFLIDRGFTEVSIPLLLSEHSLYRTGHIPKDKDNMFCIESRNLYLIPTSECVLLNLMANTCVKKQDLPKKYTAFNVNFRKEAGAAGKDTRGLIRLHQFPKVEMVAFTTPEASEEMFADFLLNGEEALKLLGLSYRVINLCSGDLGFNARKTYDLEVWMGGAGEYREVSSISYCGDFQSARLNSKYLNDGEKTLTHTLNGTCLGVGRVVAAIMENYFSQENNSIEIPEVLIPYTRFSKIYL